MTKTFCDRCSRETTDIQSGHIDGSENAEYPTPESRNRSVTEDIDVCSQCYAQFRKWARQRSALADITDDHLLGAAAVLKRAGPEFTAWMQSLSAEDCYALGRVFGAVMRADSSSDV